MNKRLINAYLMYVIKYVSLSTEDKDKISYMLEVVLSEVEKTVMYVVIFALWGKVFEMLLCMVGIMFVRTFTGGTHKKSFWGCFFYTWAILLAGIYIGGIVTYDWKLGVNIYVISLVSILLFTPVVSKQRPTVRREKQIKMRYCAICSLSVLSVIQYILFWCIGSYLIVGVALQDIDILIANIRKGGNSCEGKAD